MSLVNGLSAMGYAAGDMYGKMALEDQRAAADLAKQSRLVELTGNKQKDVAKYTDDLKNEPLNRLSRSAQDKLKIEVPLEAEKVSELSGVKPDGTKFGLTGDVEKTRGLINSFPNPEDRAEAMSQFEKQLAEDRAAAADKVKGKMRSRTSDEAMSAAVDDAKVNDLPALAAYEAQIGKPMREERRVSTAETKEENRFVISTAAEQRKAEAEGRKAIIEMAKIDIQTGTLAAQNRKIDAYIENEAAKRENEANKTENGGRGQSPDKLGAIVNSQNATIKSLIDGGKGNTPESKAAWQNAYDTAVKVRDRATYLLNESLTDRGAPPETPRPVPAPSAKPGERSSSAPPMAMPTEKAALRAGTVYQTSRGPAKWNGSAFEAQ